MKHLKKFENFHLEDPMSPDVDIDEQDYLDYKRKMSSVDSESEFTEEEEEGDWEYQEEIPIRRTIGDEIDEKKSTSYKKSGLRNPEKADLNKNKKIEGWEKSRGKAIEKAMERRGRK